MDELRDVCLFKIYKNQPSVLSSKVLWKIFSGRIHYRYLNHFKFLMIFNGMLDLLPGGYGFVTKRPLEMRLVNHHLFGYKPWREFDLEKRKIIRF